MPPLQIEILATLLEILSDAPPEPKSWLRPWCTLDTYRRYLMSCLEPNMNQAVLNLISELSTECISLHQAMK